MTYEIEVQDIIFVVEPYYGDDELGVTVTEIKGCDATDLESLGELIKSDELYSELSRKLAEQFAEDAEESRIDDAIEGGVW